MNGLAQRLYAQRHLKEHSQHDAAAFFPVSQSSFGRWEHGLLKPGERWYPKLAEYLGISVPDVWDLINDPDQQPTTLDQLMTRVDRLETDADDMGSLRQVVKSNTALRREVSDLAGQVTTLVDSVADLSGRVKALEGPGAGG